LLTGAIANGWLAVDVFFVLSGFLISYSLIREYNKQGKIDIWNFYRDKFLRLWGTLFVWVVLLMIFEFIKIFIVVKPEFRSGQVLYVL